MALPAGGLAWDIGRHPGAGLSELFEIKGADAPSGQQLLFIWGKRRDHARYVGKINGLFFGCFNFFLMVLNHGFQLAQNPLFFFFQFLQGI